MISWFLVGCSIPDPSDHDTIESLLSAWEAEGFDGAVWVSRADEESVAAGYGVCERSTGRRCTETTAFDIGSLTKQFTGAAIAALEEDGELSRETTLGEIFHSVPTDKADLTLEMLLTHTSGLRGQLGADDAVLSREAMLQGAWAQSLASAPGEVHAYTNLGYSVLGAVIEEVSGRPYESYLRDRLFEPAGMLDTGYVLPEFAPDAVAHGYGTGELGSPLAQNWADDGPYWNLRANGGLLSTPEDMARWHTALSEASVLQRETIDAMHQGRVRECADCGGWYGSGWVHVQDNGLRWHDGGNGHFYAVLLRWPDSDVFVFTVTNDWRRREEELTWQLARWVEP